MRLCLTAATCLLLLALAAAPGPAAAQTAPASKGEEGSAETPVEPVGRFEDQVSVSWVLVPVVVRDRRGYVDDLTRDDFRLWVDDERVPIVDFESGATAPVSLVFLQDLSGSMANGGKLTESKRALAFLLSRTRPDDELALATFAGELLQVDVPFTHDEQVLAESMDLWQAYGTTALHDAVAWIPRIVVQGRHPKRAAVLVTDGIDNASTMSPEQARAVVEEAQLPVYVLGMGRDPAAGRGFSASPEAASYSLLLRQLAYATGGGYFPIAPGNGAAEAAARLLEELRRQYVLAFPTGPGEARYRRLKVEVTAPGRLTVYHRRGYRGGPPSPAP
jgi:Ca-activated chloride channel family protein